MNIQVGESKVWSFLDLIKVHGCGMLKWNDIPLKLKLILYIVLGVSLIMVTTTAIIVSSVTSQEEQLAYQQSIETASNYANQFNADMQSNLAIGRTIADSMEEYDSGDRDEVNAILENLLVENPSLIGTYVAFEPDAFDGKDEEFVGAEGHDDTGRFIPYWTRIGGQLHLEPLLDYETLDYYQLPKRTQADTLTEPYLYQGELIVSYVSPVIRDEEFIGIGGVDVSLNYIDEDVSKVRIFDTGYAFTASNTGIFLTHPVNKEWIGTKTLQEFDDPAISTMAEDIRAGEGGHVETIDPTTGKEVILFYEPVKTGNYSFVLVTPNEEVFAGVTSLRNKLLVISAISIVFMAIVAYLIALSITKPIDKIVDDFKHISRDAVNGKLDSRADTDVEVDFKGIPSGLDEILDAVIKPIREAIRVSNALSEGQLDTRVEMDVHGEFKEFGDTLDNFAIELNNIIKDVNSVLTSMQNEDFTRKVQVQGDGDFGILTDGIENTRVSLDEATTQRKKAEEVLRKYADDLSEANLELKSYSLELSKANEELKSLDRMKNDFLSNVSHELKTPLVSIIGYTKLIDKGALGDINDKQKKALDTIIRNSDRLRRLVDSLLHMSMAQAKTIRYKFGDVSIPEIVDDAILDMTPMIESKGLSIEKKVSAGLSFIHGDRDKLTDMLTNLIDNAIKFTSSGGKITIYAFEEAKSAHLVVKDTGIGIPEGLISTLFQKFYQIDASTTRKYGGTGLGLYICKNIVDVHDGQIWIESEEGVGTEVHVRLPR